MAKQFRSVTSLRGDSFLINANYVISLQTKAGSTNPSIVVAELSTDGGHYRIEISPAEAKDVREWLTSL